MKFDHPSRKCPLVMRCHVCLHFASFLLDIYTPREGRNSKVNSSHAGSLFPRLIRWFWPLTAIPYPNKWACSQASLHWGLVAGLQVVLATWGSSTLGCDCSCSPLPLGSQPPFATWVLNNLCLIIQECNTVLFLLLSHMDLVWMRPLCHSISNNWAMPHMQLERCEKYLENL